MINYYKISIKGKNIYYYFNKIIKLNINIFEVQFFDNEVILKTSYNDYLKIISMKSTYEIEILEIKGIKKWQKFFFFYKLFFIMFFVGLLFIFIYSKMIFFVNINTKNEDLKEMISEELIENDIKIYSFSKKYSDLNSIANKIKEKYSNRIEWIEIKHDGVFYEINLIERISKNPINITEKYHIVSLYNAKIMNMFIEQGEVVKFIGDYVNKGEIIVSGFITKNEEVKNVVNAQGTVYGEIWQKVKITHPKEYEKNIDNKGTLNLNITIFDKQITIFKMNKKIKKEKSLVLFNGDINISMDLKYKSDKIIKKYTEDELIKIMEKMAQEEVKKSLNKNEYIILEKTLKIDSYNDRMYMEVFFKVYKDITDRLLIQLNP